MNQDSLCSISKTTENTQTSSKEAVYLSGYLIFLIELIFNDKFDIIMIQKVVLKAYLTNQLLFPRSDTLLKLQEYKKYNL